MKKGTLIIIGILVILIAVSIGCYNSLVTHRAAVEAGQANISTQLQRRADLIPNLVATVNNYTTHETDVFAAVTAAHEALLSAQTVSEMEAADTQATTALNGLVALAEAYPELTSDTVYIGLMDELAGSENRIAAARTDYNECVRVYNTAILRLPGAIFARIFGFEAADYFEASEDAATVPAVS